MCVNVRLCVCFFVGGVCVCLCGYVYDFVAHALRLWEYGSGSIHVHLHSAIMWEFGDSNHCVKESAIPSYASQEERNSSYSLHFQVRISETILFLFSDFKRGTKSAS